MPNNHTTLNDLSLHLDTAREGRTFNKKLFNTEKNVFRFFPTTRQYVTKTKIPNKYDDKNKYLRRNSNNQFICAKKIKFMTTISSFIVILFLNTKKKMAY